MSGRVVALNGVSSSGKTTLGRALQERLPGLWLLLGVDTFLTATSFKWYGIEDGITFGDDGAVRTGTAFRTEYDRWRESVGFLARAGSKIVLDEVLLRGFEEQQAWDAALAGVDVVWVKVQCDIEVASEREEARGDRQLGLARAQANEIHVGVCYDLEVDTTATRADVLAEAIAANLSRR